MGLIYFTTFIFDPVDTLFGPFILSGGLFLFLLGALHLEVFESKRLWGLALPGKVSYGAYLIHPAVLYFLWPLWVGLDTSLGFLAFIFSTIVVAWFSYRFFETPMNRGIRRVLGGTATRGASRQRAEV